MFLTLNLKDPSYSVSSILKVGLEISASVLHKAINDVMMYVCMLKNLVEDIMICTGMFVTFLFLSCNS